MTLHIILINRLILSEILLSSAASTTQTDRHYALGGELAVELVLHCDVQVYLENTAANQSILNTQSHWNIMHDMVSQG